MKKKEDWLDIFRNDPAKKNEILENLEKTSGPLEYRTYLILDELGYHPSRTIYEGVDKDGEEVLRDLDLRGFKNGFHSYSKDGLDIWFNIELIVECKSPRDTDLIAFEIPEKQMGNTPIRFPLFVNGRHLGFKLDQHYLRGFDEIFGLDAYSNNVKPAKKNELLESGKGAPITKEKDGEGKERDIVYSGFEQLLRGASVWIEKTYHAMVRSEYNTTAIEFGKFELIDDYNNRQKLITEKINSVSIPDMHINVNLMIPVLVVGKNTRLLKPVWNGRDITDFKEIDCVLYTANPAKFKNVSRIIEDRYFGQILICNEEKLNETILKLEKGMHSLINDKVIKNLDKRRMVVEILNDVYDPKSLFNSRGDTANFRKKYLVE